MDSNKAKLNDELLDKVAGGEEVCYALIQCPNCKAWVYKEDLDNHLRRACPGPKA